ncbi:SRPBCC domain-containing protein [Zhouia spongiae]|uniref:SRPBCC domain-containing protein n=1 Tax=Zhouia spongiae TaxID=2202721 RepID=A0ABY3YM01_9FLAO|nr:SRPBCC domain-containing protein [Zhouia spongiae]UNY98825.1 SRPBCC domain-containing protein [Zhouia spongiae]
MKKLSFDQFTKRIYIRSTPEKLYWCWATEEGITSWFLRAATFSRNGERLQPDKPVSKGDSYTWMWHNWDGEEKGQILEANGSDFIVISFAGNCKVTVSLKKADEAVLLSLTQSDIPTDDDNKLKVHYGCSNGWTFWLANLKAYLEYGIRLNETEFDLRNEELAGYEFVNM